jgi:hypothetical protein
MDARSYRVDVRNTPLDFPAITGLGQSSLVWQSEPHLVDDKLVLNIVMQYVLTDMDTNKHHSILAVQSIYHIPASEIKSREDVYEFYNDATIALNKKYREAEKLLPTLHKIEFSSSPIEVYKKEIDRVLNLLNSRN